MTEMIGPEQAGNIWEPVIGRYYSDNRPLMELLITHSSLVARKATAIALSHPELEADALFTYQAAMLHDIGIFKTDAAPIHCFGPHPYICHGYLGADILRNEGLPRHALVAERHTGTGLTLEQIIGRNMPIPHREMVPVSIEEQLVCFADKFFSKTRPTQEKTVEQAIASLEKFGPEGVAKFRVWCDRFL